MHIFDKSFHYIQCQIKFTLRLMNKHSTPLVELHFSTTQQMPPKYLFGRIFPPKMRENKYLKPFTSFLFDTRKLAYHQMTHGISPTALIITHHFSKLKRQFLLPKNSAVVSFLNNFKFKNLNPLSQSDGPNFDMLPPTFSINSGLLTSLYFPSSSCRHLQLFVFLLLQVFATAECSQPSYLPQNSSFSTSFNTILFLLPFSL